MPFCLRRAFSLLGLCAVLSAQTPPGTGTVQGDVTDGVTHKPIAGARVKLQAGERILFTRCDENGRFQLAEVAMGSYAVAADRPGYSPATGQPPSYARLSPDKTLAEVHVILQPYSVISGRVVDSAGVPVEGAFIELLELRPIDPNRRPDFALSASRAVLGDRQLVVSYSTRTNDLGQYRFARHPAGSYYVCAHPATYPDSRDETERATYYPRTLRATDAKPVAVAAGQEHPDIDIQLIRQAGVRVSGRVIEPVDSPKARSILVRRSIVVTPSDAPLLGAGVMPGFDEKGAFDLKDLLPGRYVIEAATTDQTDFGNPRTLLAGRRTIDVGDKDVDGVEIAMQPPFDIQGAVVFGENCPAVPVSILPRAESRLGNVAQQDIAGAGSFTLPGLIQGKYTLAIVPRPSRTSAAYRYSVASATLGDREVLQNGFELTGQPPGALRISIACGAQPAAQGVAR